MFLEGSLGIKYQCECWWIDLCSCFVVEQNWVFFIFGEIIMFGFQMYDLCMGVEVLLGLNFGFFIFNILDVNYYEYLSWVY